MYQTLGTHYVLSTTHNLRAPFFSLCQRCNKLGDAQANHREETMIKQFRNVYKRAALKMNNAQKLLDEMAKKTVVSSTKTITMYGKIGEIRKAQKVFKDMPCRSLVSWNAMLSVLVNSGRLDSAYYLFDKMPHRNSVSYVSMITGFSRAGFVSEARRIFDLIPCSEKNVISWTSMITGYAKNGQALQALKLFSLFHEVFYSLKMKPNSFTFSIVLKSCGDLQSLALAEQVHALMVKLLDEDEEDSAFVQNTLIHLHSKFGNLVDGERIFERLRKKDLGSWNTMMTGYTQCFVIERALGIFDSMKEKDTISWNIIILGLAECGRGEEALQLFICFLHSSPELKPNSSTYTIVLTVCATLTALERGKQIHAHTIKSGFNQRDLFVGNSLINMYSKCGSISESEQVFDQMVQKDIISWNSLILALADNGYAKKALEVGEVVLKMEIYNHNTFIAILTACSHGGLVEEGVKYFKSMLNKYNINPSLDHYICMIDMLGRAGKINEAYDLLCKMPFTSNRVAWASLLAACVVYRNVDVGKAAARELQVLEPDNMGNYLMLANIYNRSGRVAESRKILKFIREEGLKKDPGCSWIRIRNEVNIFVAKDLDHPEKHEIYMTLERLNKEMRDAGLSRVVDRKKKHILYD